MSLVGPRPVPAVESLTVEGRKLNGAYSLLPGVTGLAQINGRDLLTEELRLLYDGEYARCQSIRMDLRIVLMTWKWIFKGDASKTQAASTNPAVARSDEGNRCCAMITSEKCADRVGDQ
jgi:lipopolysaccharide/colanic/teichoic acid biosynthesis glycosyltransferase